jgi:hypothetical protein
MLDSVDILSFIAIFEVDSLRLQVSISFLPSHPSSCCGSNPFTMPVDGFYWSTR